MTLSLCDPYFHTFLNPNFLFKEMVAKALYFLMSSTLLVNKKPSKATAEIMNEGYKVYNIWPRTS